GLEHNKISAESRIFCGGWYSLRGDSHRYRDWRRGGHGTTNITKAITESCDVYFYDLASSLGIDTFHNFLAHFGFGQLTGVDIDGEAPALLPSRAWKRGALRQAWYPGETLIAGIGQGYILTTPLQLASATATMANHGIRMQPRMVRALQDPGSLVITPLEPIEKERLHLASASNWEQIVTAMTEVVNSPRGTARAIGIDSPYLIAGKTGTAQVFTIKQDERYDATKIDKRLQDHALFIAFAPVEKPQIALAIIVENGGHGGSAAAPIARQVMDHYLLNQPNDHAK
ncbi:MAG: penicillin-binding protein 2, partial [Halothiobacillaceae bacterium]